MKKVIVLFLLLLIADLGVSFKQYHEVFIDGDLPHIILPAPWYSEILQDPFGIKLMQTKQPVSGMGRNFAHQTMHHYYHNVPLWLQKWVDPIESAYLSSALFMFFVHFIMLWGMGALVTGRNNPFSRPNLIIASLMTVLFQFNSQYEVMGILDHAPTYVFFYIWPMSILLIAYIPYYRMLFQGGYRGFSLINIIGVSILYFYAAFTSPLTGPVALIWNVIIGVALLRHYFTRDKKKATKGSSKTFWIPFLLIGVLSLVSLYAFYIGRFNSENLTSNHLVGLTERYVLLTKGFKFMLTYTYGFSLLLFALLANWVIHRNLNTPYLNQFKWMMAAAFIFCLVYILLLPLGGYRSYRSMIIRYDTFIPVTLTVMWLYLHSAWHLLTTQFDQKKIYIGALLAFSALYFYIDLSFPNDARCEREALEQIRTATEYEVKLKERCRTLSWEPYVDQGPSEISAKVLQLWHITVDEKRFYYLQAPNQ